jgi:hypothetical protein
LEKVLQYSSGKRTENGGVADSQWRGEFAFAVEESLALAFFLRR